MFTKFRIYVYFISNGVACRILYNSFILKMIFSS